jgi:hypothetical protein
MSRRQRQRTRMPRVQRPDQPRLAVGTIGIDRAQPVAQR